MKNKTVFVGLSGGVDSSVAASRLLADGYNVVGVFIKVWHPEWLVCNWEQERLDAMRVAAKLGIPFLTCDAEAAYRDEVAKYFIDEYLAGRTPNPDVMCNREVKFGRFLEFATEYGADYVATGHYARSLHGEHDAQLLRGVDKNKDQTYFLWTLTQAQLTKVLFPVGDTPKDDIRKEAASAGLITADKRDSQGICFLGHVDIVEFLSHYTTLVPGDVVNEAGEVIGHHKGALVYTLGQRHGFTVMEKSSEQTALYVAARDLKKNTITVSPSKPTTEEGNLLLLKDVSYTRKGLRVGDTLQLQTRYRQTPQPATVQRVSDGELVLSLESDISAPAIGQSCVLYDKDECLGGGIIESCQS